MHHARSPDDTENTTTDSRTVHNTLQTDQIFEGSPIPFALSPRNLELLGIGTSTSCLPSSENPFLLTVPPNDSHPQLLSQLSNTSSVSSGLHPQADPSHGASLSSQIRRRRQPQLLPTTPPPAIPSLPSTSLSSTTASIRLRSRRSESARASAQARWERMRGSTTAAPPLSPRRRRRRSSCSSQIPATAPSEQASMTQVTLPSQHSEVGLDSQLGECSRERIYPAEVPPPTRRRRGPRQSGMRFW